MTLISAPPPAPDSIHEESPAVMPEALVEAQASAVALSQWQLIRLLFARHRLAVISLRALVLLYVVAVFAEFFAPYPAGEYDLDHAYCPPQLVRWNMTDGLHVRAMKQIVDPITLRRTYEELPDVAIPLRLFAASEHSKLWGLIPIQRKFLDIDQQKTAELEPQQVSFHFLGGDRYGRDILSRIIHGSRISLSVGLIGIVITFILGVSIGGISGYIGGRTDNFIQRGIEIVNAMPQIPLWLAFAAAFPPDWPALKIYFLITVVLALLGWTGLARVVRGKILSLREEDYVMAARLMGAGHTRILFRHLIPGFTSHIIVSLSLSVPGMILGETALSFLGLGLRPPIVSWGVMLQDCMDISAIRYYPWLLLPVGFIVVTVLAFNFLGDGLRDAADPYSSR